MRRFCPNASSDRRHCSSQLHPPPCDNPCPRWRVSSCRTRTSGVLSRLPLPAGGFRKPLQLRSCRSYVLLILLVEKATARNAPTALPAGKPELPDRKSTRLNSSHLGISY